jgi:hypothetical protein
LIEPVVAASGTTTIPGGCLHPRVLLGKAARDATDACADNRTHRSADDGARHRAGCDTGSRSFLRRSKLRHGQEGCRGENKSKFTHNSILDQMFV